jgi:quinol-cytochrome oxidoreductase complex cytochrome b subunit
LLGYHWIYLQNSPHFYRIRFVVIHFWIIIQKKNNNKNYQKKKQKNIYSSEMKTQVSPKNSQRLVEKVQNTKIEI